MKSTEKYLQDKEWDDRKKEQYAMDCMWWHFVYMYGFKWMITSSQ